MANLKEFFVLAFVLTAPAPSNATNESDAYQAVAQASYKQSGIDKMVDAYVQKELRHVPKEVQTIVGNGYLLGKMISERKAIWTLTF